jgi:hypothetical protein
MLELVGERHSVSLPSPAGTERLEANLSNPVSGVSLAALYRPVSCRIGLADSCRGSPCRASAAPRSAAPLHPHPRQRWHAEVGARPVHSQAGQSPPKRFPTKPTVQPRDAMRLVANRDSSEFAGHRSLASLLVGDSSSVACSRGRAAIRTPRTLRATPAHVRASFLALAEVDPASVPDAPVERGVALVSETMDAEPTSRDSADPSAPAVCGVVAWTGVGLVAAAPVGLRLIG